MPSRSSIWQAPPFKLLLHMEWILLGIAVASSLSHISMRWRRLAFSQELMVQREVIAQRPMGVLLMSVLSLILVLLVGGMGWRLPLGTAQQRTKFLGKVGSNSRASAGGWLGDRRADQRLSWGLSALYIAASFGLSWLAVLLGGRGSVLFPPLLLIVVTRGCLLFPRRGRWVVAGTALASFLMMQYLAFQKLRPFGVPLDRLPRPPGGRRLSEELIQALRFNAMVNVTILFALVLGFVLLLVGALLQEARSREQLAEANQQLRRYALRIEDQAAIEERSRIAREIHDTVGHCLTAQSIQLENVALSLQTEADASSHAKADQHLQAAHRLGREALQNVRQAVARLRVHPLQGQSLGDAIDKLVQDFQSHSTISLESKVELAASPPQDIAIVLYRILQEGLTNLTKHSQATEAQLKIYQDNEGWHLRLTDNGQGFNPAQNTTGFGLQSMTERAIAVQGQFKLVSAPGEGCSMALDLPI